MPGAAGVVTADVELGRLVAYATARFREAEPGRFVRRAEELQVLVRAGKVARFAGRPRPADPLGSVAIGSLGSYSFGEPISVAIQVDTDVPGRAELADALDRRREEVINRWLVRVKASVPADASLTDLKDGIDEYLAAISDALRRGGRVSVEAEKTWLAFARSHALTRVRLGFDVRQLVREFMDLRRVLFDVIQEEAVLREPDQASRLADLTDAAIALALDSYVASRDYASRKQQAEFIGFLTHELKNPLTSASMSVALLDKVPGQDHKLVARVRRSLNAIQGLIDKVMLRGQLEAAEVLSRPIHLRLLDVVNTAIVSAREEAVEKGLELSVDVAPDISAYADPTLTVTVLQNLVGNAVKYTDTGAVRLEAEDRGSEVLVHVRDTCAGLSPEELDTIFEPFKRGRTVKPGTGLGLAVSRRAVELQGGRLHAESTADQGGCHFWFSLPKLPH